MVRGGRGTNPEPNGTAGPKKWRPELFWTADESAAEADAWEWVRSLLVKPLGAMLREQGNPHGLYASYRIRRAERVACLEVPEESVEEMLELMGFVRNPVAAWKFLGDGRQESGSWAWRGEPMPPFGDGEDWRPNQYHDDQLHVVLFDVGNSLAAGENRTEVYAHWEPNWKTRPVAHYLGRQTSTWRAGPAREMMMSMLTDFHGERRLDEMIEDETRHA